MFTLTFLPHLRRHLIFLKPFRVIPFGWDGVRGRVTYTTGRTHRFITKIQMASHLLYVLLQVVMILLSPYSNAKKCIGLVFTIVYAVALGLRFDWDLDPVPMELINSLLDYEEKLLKGVTYKKTLPDKLMSIVLYLVTLAAMGLPVFCVLVLAKYPCAPPFLGSMLSYCHNQSELEQGIPIHIRIIVLVTEFIMFGHAVTSAAFYVNNALCSGILCLWDYLKILSKRESNTPEKMDTCLQLYRQLRVLEILNSLACSKRLFPTLVTGFPTIQFASFYVCVKLHESISWPAFGMFPMLYFDGCFIIMVIVTAAARVFKWSDGQLEEWARHPGRGSKRMALVRRILRSLPPIKIRMGGNFVEPFTPLVIQDFCVRTQASVLLLAQS